ncbi:aminopeptidase N-like [Fopius arisanus]|uniref:Aminopeptidase n=1 Tax=Fopius arisanus TaxID=64838 RepID=A0A9R1T7W0_9HYME|nr:PREDICTED: aminopeptidase N-like [Fopius arisanus]
MNIMRNKLGSFLLLIIGGIGQLSSSLPYSLPINEDKSISGSYRFRLPSHTAPILYTLNIDPHIDEKKFTFDGTSAIIFEVLSPTSAVTLHTSSLLEIDEQFTSLVHIDGTIEKPISQKTDTDLEFFTILFDHILDIGAYELNLKWTGTQSGDHMGFYRTIDYTNPNHTRYVATTKFQPLAARRAFPCWDEPAFKAQYDISLKHYVDYTALSNMPVKTQTLEEDGMIWTTFQRSPMMSTYLVVFVLAEFESRSNDNGNLALWGPPEKLHYAAAVVDVIPEIMRTLESYTGLAYNLPRLDGVIFNTYPSLAMEHWGLISYSENILYDPEIDPISHRDDAFKLVAHEIAHQWMGNLVTPAWWNDVWLSESLASYLSYVTLDAVRPNLHTIDKFVVDGSAYYSGPRNIPVRWMPNSPKELPKLFSKPYIKGVAIVRMLEHMVTKEVFHSGIKNYLRNNQFGSVVTDNLWEALQESYNEIQLPHLNIKEVMDPWLDQSGYPMLDVTRDYETGLITITQINAENFDSGNMWTIPITYATTSKPDFSVTQPNHFLRDVKMSFIPDEINSNDWIILNLQQTGYYRVNYDWENWKRIAAYLNTENYQKIHVLNRAQLLTDIVDLAAEDEQYNELLIDMIMYLRRETNPLPWISAEKILKKFSDCPFQLYKSDLFQKFVLSLMENAINNFGLKDSGESEDSLIHMARIKLLPWACEFGHEGCKAVAPVMLRDILTGQMNKSFIRENAKWIYRTALTYANESVWDQMINVHMASPSEHNVFQYLGYSKNLTLIKKYLPLLFTEETGLSSLDIIDAFDSLAKGSADNYNFGLEYLIKNIGTIIEIFDKNDDGFMIEWLWGLFANEAQTPEQWKKLMNFVGTRSFKEQIDAEEFIEDYEYRQCFEKSSAVLKAISEKVVLYKFYLREKL